MKGNHLAGAFLRVYLCLPIHLLSWITPSYCPMYSSLKYGSIVFIFVCLGSVCGFGEILGDFEYAQGESSITITGYHGKSGVVSIPDSIDGKPVTKIGHHAFAGKVLEPATLCLPASLQIIELRAFANCSGFSGVLSLPENVTVIDDGAFSGCTGFSGDLSIPKTVVTIGEEAFLGCVGFSGNVTFSGAVNSIENKAFEGCEGLVRALFLKHAPLIVGSGVFDDTFNGFRVVYDRWAEGFSVPMWNGYPCELRGSVFEDYEYVYVKGIKDERASATITWYLGNGGDVVIPDHINGRIVKEIGVNAFAGRVRDPSRVILPSDLKIIGESAFARCSGFKGFLNLPKSLTTIGDGAFDGCSGISGVIIIPEAVSSIGVGAFMDCASLGGAYFTADAPIIGRDAFSGTGSDFKVTCVSGAKGFARPLWKGLPCDFIGPPHGDYEYLDGGGVVTLTRYLGYGGDIVVPDSINGKPVKVIAPDAFAGRLMDDSTITFPASLEAIGENAFFRCHGIKRALFMGDAPFYVGPNSFQGVAHEFKFGFQQGAKGFGTPLWHWHECEPFGRRSGDYEYVEDASGVTLTLYHGRSGNIIIPDTIRGKPVTKIGASTFAGKLTSFSTLKLPASLQEIGAKAFVDCPGLSGNVLVPPSVRTIGQQAFFCLEPGNGITSVEFLGDAPSLGSDAFIGCASGFCVRYRSGSTGFATPDWEGFRREVSARVFEEWEYTDDGTSVTIVGYQGRGGRIVIPKIIDGKPVISIGPKAFVSTLLVPTSLSFPPNLESIGDQAFHGCRNLTGTLLIPGGVRRIGNGAFHSCSGLSGLVLQPGLESIGDEAFRGCSGLIRTLIIPDTVRKIGNAAFHSCSGITSLMIRPGLTSMGKEAFSMCSGLVGDLSLPSGIELIGQGAFKGCTGVSGLVLDEGFEYFGPSMFEGCTGIEGILTMPASVGAVLAHSFRGCTGITAVVFPASIVQIDFGAFEGCDQLITAIFEGKAPGYVASGAFRECARGFSVVFKQSDSGFAIPEWNGYPCRAAVTNSWAQGSATQESDLGEYEWETDGASVKITGYRGRGVRIIIPESIEGKPVTSIGVAAFYNKINVPSSVVFPSSLVSIEDKAFQFCRHLTGVLSIPGNVKSIGASAFAHCGGISGLDLQDGVESIGDVAFQNCAGLTGQLIFPGSLVSIGKMAFSYCEGISGSLTIPGSVKYIGPSAFEYCNKVSAVVLENGVETIGRYAFSPCREIAGTLVLPSSVKSIEEHAFGTSKITGLILQDGVASIGQNAFLGNDKISGKLTIPGSVKTVGQNSFLGCKGLSEVVVLDGVETIESNAFERCVGLNRVFISGSVKSIGHSAFAQCDGLQSLTIENGVENVGDKAFWKCKNLNGILTFPDSVKTVGSSAFEGCNELTGLVLGSGLSSIGINAFSGCERVAGQLVIPGSVKTIGSAAFKLCRGLSGIVLNEGLEALEPEAFMNCDGVVGRFCFPGSVRRIESRAFYGCKGIDEVVFQEGLESIEDAAFSQCNALSRAVFEGNLPARIAENAFYNVAPEFEMIHDQKSN